MNFEEMIEVCTILASYNYGEEGYFSAEHDELYFSGGPPPVMLSEDHAVRLEELHLNWIVEYQCWQVFT